MMKERYERIELDVIEFQTDDVIMTSTNSSEPESKKDKYELPIV